MQTDPAGQHFDVVIVGSGASGGWAAKRLTEAGLRVAVLEAGRALTDADYKEHVQPPQLKYRGRTKAPFERAQPRAVAVVRRARVERRLVRQRHRGTVRRRLRSEVPVGAPARRRRPHEHLGTRLPAHERHRLQGGVARRRRRRLANHLRGDQAVLRPRRGVRRRLRHEGRARAVPGRALPAADGPHLQRDGRPLARQEGVRLHRHAGPHRQSHQADQRPPGVSLLRAVRARVRDALVLQLGVHDDEGCGGDGPVHARHRRDGLQGARWTRHAPGQGRALHRPRDAAAAARSSAARWRSARRRSSRCGCSSTRRRARTRTASRTRAACWAST